MTYADRTRVPIERSRAEIEKLLKRAGADQFFSGWSEAGAIVGFRLQVRQVKLWVPIVDKSKRVSDPDQIMRTRWRALALLVKAKLEAVAIGATTFEEEFLAGVVLPDGQTVGSWLKPQLAVAYDRGNMPPLLEAPK